MTAIGVMFHIVDDGRLYLGGNGTFILRPPGCEGEPLPAYPYPEWQQPWWENDTYKGMSIFQARDNKNDSTIIGTAGYSIEGTLFFPTNHIGVQGTAGTTFHPGPVAVEKQYRIGWGEEDGQETHAVTVTEKGHL